MARGHTHYHVSEKNVIGEVTASFLLHSESDEDMQYLNELISEVTDSDSGITISVMELVEVRRDTYGGK